MARIENLSFLIPRKRHVCLTLVFVMVCGLFIFDCELPEEYATHIRVMKSVGKLLATELIGVELVRQVYNHQDIKKAYGDDVAQLLWDAKEDLFVEVADILQPKVVLQVGDFVGYNSVQFARALPQGSKLITCSSGTWQYNLSNWLIEFAGVQDKIVHYKGAGHNLMRRLHLDQVQADVIVTDLAQPEALEDFILAENLKVLTSDVVIVADNAHLDETDIFKNHLLQHPSYDATVESLYPTPYPGEEIWPHHIVLGMRKKHTWGEFRDYSETIANVSKEDNKTGHYYFHPASGQFLNELGRTEEYQKYLEELGLTTEPGYVQDADGYVYNETQYDLYDNYYEEDDVQQYYQDLEAYYDYYEDLERS